MEKLNRKIVIYTIIIIILLLTIIAILFLKFTHKDNNNDINIPNEEQNELEGYWNRNSEGESYGSDKQKYSFAFASIQYLSINDNTLKRCTQKENSEEYECDDYTYKIENNNLVLTEKNNKNNITYTYEIKDNILVLSETIDDFTTIYKYTRANG